MQRALGKVILLFWDYNACIVTKFVEADPRQFRSKPSGQQYQDHNHF